MATKHVMRAVKIVGSVKLPPLTLAKSQEKHGRSVPPSIAKPRELFTNSPVPEKPRNVENSYIWAKLVDN